MTSLRSYKRQETSDVPENMPDEEKRPGSLARVSILGMLEKVAHYS